MVNWKMLNVQYSNEKIQKEIETFGGNVKFKM